MRTPIPSYHYGPPASRKPKICHQAGPAPAFEKMEDRLLLASDGLLQGTAFVDIDFNGIFDGEDFPKVGATIQLCDQVGTVLAETTTDSNGGYLFDNLDPGIYRIKEIPTEGFVNFGTQILSQLYPAMEIDAGTIEVEVLNTSTMTINFDVLKYYNVDKLYDNLIVTLYGTQVTEGFGRMGIDIKTGDLTTTIASFGTFCLDPTEQLGYGLNIWTFKPETAPSIPGQTTYNAGRIAYLYNKYGMMPTSEWTRLDAVAMQLAISELELDETPDLSAGNFRDIMAHSDPWLLPTVLDITTLENRIMEFINESEGKNEKALFLDAVAIVRLGKQEVIAAGTFNFANIPGVGAEPGIDIEKTTNGTTNSNPVAPDYDNEDAADGVGVPILTPGSDVTWTYQVTNTGNVPYTFDEIVIVDDAGTPGDTSDDMSTTNGQITFLSVAMGNDDNVLEPGEIWLYTASGIVQQLTQTGDCEMITMTGRSCTDGTNGNVRTFSSASVSVNASAWSRDKSSGAWSASWLGAYSGGIGVTDSSEGSGSGNRHTVDNIGRDNFVLFEFSDIVVVDSAYLGYVVDDSDLKVWIGTLNDPFNNHVTLSDAVLASMGFTEVNLTNSSSARTADINAGEVAGNVLIIAADPGDKTPNDQFKIKNLKVCPVESVCYANLAVVTVPGATDSDMSHYCNGVSAEPDAKIDIEKYVKVQTPCPAGEGLTPGFWKQPHHFDNWVGYSPSDSYEAVFGVDLAKDVTLVKALGANGGGVNALLRHSTAALLNAASADVNYAYTVAEVIALTQAAFASGDYEETKDLFEAQNELGTGSSSGPCPDDGLLGVDADDAPGLQVNVGDIVIITYVVSNPGTVAIMDVIVIDDNGTPDDLTDDFSPDAVLLDGHNVGDVNGNDLLDPGEQWIYRSTEIAGAGLHTNIALVTGTPVDEMGNPIGPDVTDLDPANYYAEPTKPCKGEIGNFVWEDTNKNGVQDRGEKGIAGVIVKLLDKSGAVVKTTTTDSSGYYNFDCLAATDYRVKVIAPAGFNFTKRDAGRNGAIDSDVNTCTGLTDVLTLKCGEKKQTIDAGLVRIAYKGLDCDFWKQFWNWSKWDGYSRSTSFKKVFGVNASGNVSLLSALSLSGTSEKALMRNAVAAILNASHDKISYPYSISEIIDIVQSAYRTKKFSSASSLLESANCLGANLYS